jgi:signal transduction histidine kinase
VLQEALQNIAKHSRASEARVVLGPSAEGVCLSIQDSGMGFSVDEIPRSGGIGLSSIRERVRLVRGTVSIQSAPGEGTELQVFVPIGETHVQSPRADRR